MNFIFIYILVLFLALPVSAVMSKSKFENNRDLESEIIRENLNIKNQIKDMNLLSSQIRTLEAKLSEKQNTYLGLAKNKKKIEIELSATQIKLNELYDSIENKKKELKKILLRISLQNLMNKSNDPLESPSELLAKKLLEKKLIVLYGEFNNLGKSSESLNLQFLNTKEKYQIISKEEQELADILIQLEEFKKEKAQEFVRASKLTDVSLNSKNEFEKKLINKKIAPRVANEFLPVNLFIRWPLESYSHFESSKGKGVFISYMGEQSVLAPHEGTVVYQGELGGFGKVIILEFDKKLRSVLLGNITAITTKGQKVKKGEKIGLTKSEAFEVSKVYYELRLENKAIDTLKYVMSLKNQEAQNQNIKL